ncbi:prepilin-type N-terminal cleavage/methylation domain-containing protein [Candidatus Kaiserbacteria bacterium]|nr:prepilin-type N-terminal cleavage/methylation domain-containing protein [Candidatus Kaiserbacteria bacterium]
MNTRRGYTLVELIVAVGLFALVMLLTSGAYLVMIGLNRQAQGIATGIDNLSFALESMTRDIRTGTGYNCDNAGDCSGGGSFSFRNQAGEQVTYDLSDSALRKTVGATRSILTDPSVTVSSLKFYASGTARASGGDTRQSRVTLIVSGTVATGPGATRSFVVETGATMRGSDL